MLLKERYKGWKEDKEDVISCMMTSRKREYTEN